MNDEERKNIPEIERIIAENKLEHFVDEKTSLIYEDQVAKFSRAASSFFIMGVLIFLIIFIVLWYFSVDSGSLNGYFNSVFCNK